ncbi:MAG TPA: gas vesicle protein GvpK [Bacillota bacterium]|nr:gas vesicle protein GvpK [Bacillota bacterium]
MAIQIQEDKLKEGLLGLVVALVEIIAEVLKLQALKRITSGRLDEEQVERLGQSMMEIEMVIEKIKIEQGLEETVGEIRGNLDDLIEDLLIRSDDRALTGE